MSKEKLKPCPFHKEFDEPEMQGEKRKHQIKFYVMCLLCEATGPTEGTESKAIKAWNRRAK